MGGGRHGEQTLRVVHQGHGVRRAVLRPGLVFVAAQYSHVRQRLAAVQPEGRLERQHAADGLLNAGLAEVPGADGFLQETQIRRQVVAEQDHVAAARQDPPHDTISERFPCELRPAMGVASVTINPRKSSSPRSSVSLSSGEMLPSTSSSSGRALLVGVGGQAEV